MEHTKRYNVLTPENLNLIRDRALAQLNLQKRLISCLVEVFQMQSDAARSVLPLLGEANQGAVTSFSNEMQNLLDSQYNPYDMMRGMGPTGKYLLEHIDLYRFAATGHNKPYSPNLGYNIPSDLVIEAEYQELFNYDPMPCQLYTKPVPEFDELNSIIRDIRFFTSTSEYHWNKEILEKLKKTGTVLEGEELIFFEGGYSGPGLYGKKRLSGLDIDTVQNKVFLLEIPLERTKAMLRINHISGIRSESNLYYWHEGENTWVPYTCGEYNKFGSDYGVYLKGTNEALRTEYVKFLESLQIYSSKEDPRYSDSLKELFNELDEFYKREPIQDSDIEYKKDRKGVIFKSISNFIVEYSKAVLHDGKEQRMLTLWEYSLNTMFSIVTYVCEESETPFVSSFAHPETPSRFWVQQYILNLLKKRLISFRPLSEVNNQE